MSADSTLAHAKPYALAVCLSHVSVTGDHDITPGYLPQGRDAWPACAALLWHALDVAVLLERLR